MPDLDLRSKSILALSESYVEALQEGKADWREYYQVTSALIRPNREEPEPDGE